MIIEGLLSVLNLYTIGFIFLGVVVGIIFGAIPGLTSTMGVALCLPLTFSMSPLDGIAMLIAVFVGGTSGGLISAILLDIPGTPSSVATTFDGTPMAARGEGGRALGIGIIYSFIGTVFSIIALIFIAPTLAKVALKFGPYEFFTICIFALTLIGGMAGKSIYKGILSGSMGILFSLVGVAPVGGAVRFTFGIGALENGLNILPVMIGLFAMSEMLKQGLTRNVEISSEVRPYKIKGLGFTWNEFKEQSGNMVRSAFLGIGIGILPGIGSATSNLIAYSTAKQRSKHPEKFGTGCMDGIVASETSNNASIGGSLIPLLTLGIPGDTVTAMILGGLTLHGIVPGPLLFTNSGVLVYGIFGAFILATIFMVIVEFGGIQFFVKLLSVPKHFLMPVILVLCVVGTFGLNHQISDIWVALAFGVLGFYMNKNEFPLAPLILGFVLGGIIETNLIRGLMYTNGNFFLFFTSPIAAVFMILTLLYIGYMVRKELRRGKTVHK
ncbi:MAG: tripartite tricarboxylate transporter permease [Sphaerochaeta sp.]|nr:tripartite tricarboxylate transporter permease [Sphaerochaeta sp.]